MIGDTLEQYTYEYLMRKALSYVPDDRDKRQGSVIYDALAPFCQSLAAGALQLRNFYTQTYAVTATGEDLENRVAEQGIKRYAATYAVKRITLADAAGNPVIVPAGARFSTVSDTRPINYVVTAQYEKDGVAVPGDYQATCEEAGIIGNQYSGNLINITFIQGLASAYMSTTLVPARDEETDEELRERYFEALNQKSFGGNFADYKNKVRELYKGSVGDVQIYPVWKGGGTVKLSIVDASYGPCSPEFVAQVQEKIDPELYHGLGIGVAPIGHSVTIDTPDEVDINVSATVTFEGSYTLGQVKTEIVSELSAYIQSLRRAWASENNLHEYHCEVFRAKITSAIIAALGVANVTDVLLNGAEKDIVLTETGAVQELPKLSKVTINGEVIFNVQTTS